MEKPAQCLYGHCRREFTPRNVGTTREQRFCSERCARTFYYNARAADLNAAERLWGHLQDAHENGYRETHRERRAVAPMTVMNDQTQKLETFYPFVMHTERFPIWCSAVLTPERATQLARDGAAPVDHAEFMDAARRSYVADCKLRGVYVPAGVAPVRQLFSAFYYNTLTPPARKPGGGAPGRAGVRALATELWKLLHPDQKEATR